MHLLLALWLTADAIPVGCTLPGDPRAEAERLLVGGQAASPEALGCAELAVVAAGADGAARSAGLRLLGRVLEDRGDWPSARARFEAALELERDARPPRPEALADSLADLAGVALRLGDRLGFERALRELGPAARSGAARARLLTLQARGEREGGRYARGLALATEAWRAWRDVRPDVLTRVAALNLLGELEWFLGRFERSRDWHRQALELARGLGPRHPAVGLSLGSLALVELALGDVDRALELEREAVEVTRATRGPDHPESLDRLQDLASLEVEAGDYPAALQRYEGVLEATRRRFGGDSDQAAHLLHNLGLLEERLGRPGRAGAYLDQARVLWEGLRGPRHPYVARALEQLAQAEIELADLATAARHLERAAEIRSEAGPAEDLGRAWDLARLAEVRRRQGRAGEAARLASRAFALCAPQAARREKDAAPTLGLLGDLELALGRAPQAQARFRAALAIDDRIYGRGHPRSASLRARLATSLLRAGQPRAAFEAAEEAERRRRQHLSRTLRYLSESQALDFARQEPAGRDVLLSIVAEGAAAEGEAAVVGAVASSRALVLDEMAARRPATRSDEAGAIEVARQRLARLLYWQWDRPQASRQALLDAAQAELERLERRVAAREAARRPEAGPGDVTTQALAAALPAGAALVSFVRYRHATPSAVVADERYLAFVVRAEDPRPQVRRLGGAADLERALAVWRAALTDVTAAQLDPRAADERARQAGRALAARLWDPLAQALADRGLVFVVPDGPLALVDFAALPGPDGQPLVEGRPVLHQLSAERDLLRWAEPPPAADRLLALGGPDYDANATAAASRDQSLADGWRSGPCPTPGAGRFEFLPQAAAEAEELAQAWERREGASAPRLLLGSAATETAFKREAPAAGLLHLATHGFFADPACPGQESAGLRGAPARNPLLAAGLALAGANRADAATPGDDGLLTAAEVAGLDLTQARWVVLSACGSGLGRVQQGEGVLGLQRAFTVAGAGTVVMSLWAVDDHWARVFMRALYDARLEAGLSTAEALRAAQRALRQRLLAERGAAPPALWATFVAVGDWH